MADKNENKKKALSEKDLGNTCYKKKEFKKALVHYDKAIALDSTVITFYTNKAAVFFEQGQHDKCREVCLKAIDVGRSHNADTNLLAKAYARIGNSFMKEKEFEQAKIYFKRSLLENNMKDIIEKVHQCEEEIKEAERLAYVNPDISREEKTKGIETFKSGDYQDAIKHFTEACRRNPDDAKLYFHRAAAFMKLKEFKAALEDYQICVLKDSSYAKGHMGRGAALESMMKYDLSMEAYQNALDLDPKMKKATKAYYRCLNNDYIRRNNNEEVQRRAREDPQIDKIMSDPVMEHILEQMTQDPKSIQKHLKNPEIVKNIQKLLEVGAIRVQL